MKTEWKLKCQLEHKGLTYRIYKTWSDTFRLKIYKGEKLKHSSDYRGKYATDNLKDAARGFGVSFRVIPHFDSISGGYDPDDEPYLEYDYELKPKRSPEEQQRYNFIDDLATLRRDARDMKEYRLSSDLKAIDKKLRKRWNIED